MFSFKTYHELQSKMNVLFLIFLQMKWFLTRRRATFSIHFSRCIPSTFTSSP